MRILSRLIDLIYPPRCPLCGDIVTKRGELCGDCDSTLPVIFEPVCRFCGREKYKCGCNNERHIFSGVVSPFYYEGKAKDGIYRLKYNDIPAVNEFFAQQLAQVIVREYPNMKFDFITCVPMHRDSLKQRGYNPSQVLAQRVGELIGIGFYPCLVKLYPTKLQHKLTKNERKGNVLGAYDVDEKFDVEGKSVLLIDDITTTGATFDECAKVLRFAGAKSVFCASAAATRRNVVHKKENIS